MKKLLGSMVVIGGVALVVAAAVAIRNNPDLIKTIPDFKTG